MSVEMVVGEHEAGLRLDVFLARRLHDVSRAEIRRVVGGGGVMLNGRRARKGNRVAAGDRLSLHTSPSPRDFDPIPSSEMPLSVLLETDGFVVVDKPAGVPCHPLRADERRTIANAIAALYPEAAAVGYARREAGLLHRLDNDTSGALVVARHRLAFERLREQLRRGAIDKRYLAVVEGTPTAPRAIDLPLTPDRSERRRVRVGPLDAGARLARTELSSVEELGERSLVEVSAPRALRHQVRAHLAAIGHPLSCDLLYGGPDDGLGRHFLHASSIAFVDPLTEEQVTVSSPLPEDLARFVDALRSHAAHASPEV